jgi:hypothetical protein
MYRQLMCNSCGLMWDLHEKECLNCGRELQPMKDTLITVSNEADLDMFRKETNEDHDQ